MSVRDWHAAGELPDPPDELDWKAQLKERIREKIREDFPRYFCTDPLDIPAYFLELADDPQSRIQIHPSFIRDALGVYAAEEAVPGRLP